jgi:hypothetical protein
VLGTAIRGPLIKGKTTLLKRKSRTHLTNQPRLNTQTKPTACYGLAAPHGPSNKGTNRPRANLHLARWSDAPQADLRLARGFNTSRVDFRLAREASALQRISASLEAFPRPMDPHLLLPTRALIAPSCRMCCGQKANPRHTDPLTPPGNPTPALCIQAVVVQPSRALYKHCTLAMRRGRRHSKALCHLLPPFLYA